jgi:hypothetical protein
MLPQNGSIAGIIATTNLWRWSLVHGLASFSLSLSSSLCPFFSEYGAWRNGTSFGLNDLEALLTVAREAKE